MQIAISSTGNTPESLLDSRFGRCAYFALYDTDLLSVEYSANPNKNNLEGAGPASVQWVASRGVQKVVSGEFGAKVGSLFDSLHIQAVPLHDARLTIGEIIERLTSYAL